LSCGLSLWHRRIKRRVTVSVPLISIVDDDDGVRVATGGLVETLGYDVESFESGEAFLGSRSLEKTRCLIADVQMPGMTACSSRSVL
jgi:FixJ family two-component response regulator